VDDVRRGGGEHRADGPCGDRAHGHRFDAVAGLPLRCAPGAQHEDLVPAGAQLVGDPEDVVAEEDGLGDDGDPHADIVDGPGGPRVAGTWVPHDRVADRR
jgi:hypothetical protein